MSEDKPKIGLTEISAVLEDIWGPVVKAHARRLVEPMTFWPDDELSPESKAKVLAWIDATPAAEVARVIFPDDEDED